MLHKVYKPSIKFSFLKFLLLDRTLWEERKNMAQLWKIYKRIKWVKEKNNFNEMIFYFLFFIRLKLVYRVISFIFFFNLFFRKY